MSGASAAHPGAPGVPHHLPDHDTGYYHPTHGRQPHGNWDRASDDPHFGSCLPGPGQVRGEYFNYIFFQNKRR